MVEVSVYSLALHLPSNPPEKDDVRVHRRAEDGTEDDAKVG